MNLCSNPYRTLGPCKFPAEGAYFAQAWPCHPLLSAPGDTKAHPASRGLGFRVGFLVAGGFVGVKEFGTVKGQNFSGFWGLGVGGFLVLRTELREQDAR